MDSRRNARLRREFLYRKALEGKDKELYEKKQRFKRAIEAGEPVPKDLKAEEKSLRRELELDSERATKKQAIQDDEYQNAGIEDPKLCLTTSKSPSSRLQSFAKEMKLILPNCTRVNRGQISVEDLVEMCRRNGVTDLIVLHETRGEPDGMIVSHLPYGPTAYFGLFNCVTRHDIKPAKKMTLAHPHLVFHNFSTPLGQRVENILKYLFPVPRVDSVRVITFYNQDDFISFRHHRADPDGDREVDLEEMGPRFEMKLFRIRLGAFDQPEAKSEWELRPFMNTAAKRRFL